MSLIPIENSADYENAIKGNELVVIHFYADWATQCNDMDAVMLELAKKPDLKNVKFTKLPAEDLPEISLKHKVEAVPTFILLRNGQQVDSVEGANALQLTQKVTKEALKVVKPYIQKPVESLESRLKQLINRSPVMLFMKGNSEEPKCGFSRELVRLLQEQSVSFQTFDILQDQQVREGLKKYSEWPTYPQLYINGELVGGLDVVKELIATGEFKNMVPKGLEDRLKQLINQEEIMLFMKGSPVTPRCGFSKQIIEILNSTNVKYGTFDILTDDDVRQGLKEFSKWPTFPQLYVKGELVGGLDIIKELQQTGDLMDTLKPPS